MKIIGHRGVAGAALENSLESINYAMQADVDAIEFDVRMTADKQFVLCHDSTTWRVSEQVKTINAEPLSVIKRVKLRNGERIPTLVQVLKLTGDRPLYIEPKGGIWAHELAKLLRQYNTDRLNVIAFDHDELAAFHSKLPQVDTYALQKLHATELFETIRYASKAGFAGIDMNFWLLNPLTYWWAKRNKLRIVVYTVNKNWIARYLVWLFPNIDVTSDLPHELRAIHKHRKRARR